MNEKPLHFAILGSGAVGGYYGAKLAVAGQRITFLARGAHLNAMRERGLTVRSPLGDFTIQADATDDPGSVEGVDVVVLAVKTYDNESALPMLKQLIGDRTTVLTLQNGVDSVDQVADVVGEQPVLGGAAYVATAVSKPGVIEQTGAHRRIVFGEVFGDRSCVSDRVERIGRTLAAADIQVETVADARVRLWEKLIYLAPFAAFTGTARLPAGPLWTDLDIRDLFLQAIAEVERVARAEGIRVNPTIQQEITKYMDTLPPSTRSSLLIDLSLGKRIEVEALQGSVVRRGRSSGVPTPIMATLYAALKPHVDGQLPGH